MAKKKSAATGEMTLEEAKMRIGMIYRSPKILALNRELNIRLGSTYYDEIMEMIPKLTDAERAKIKAAL